MKRLACALLFFLLAPTHSFAMQTLAVMDLKAIGTDQSLAEAVSENLRTMLVLSGAFKVVERRQIEAILGEQKLSQTGITDNQQDAIKIGGLAEASQILTGSITKMFTSYTINARLLDVKSGVCVLAQKADIASEAEFPKKIDELATFFSNRQESNPTPAPVDIVGTYRVKGSDYVGKLLIAKNREAYKITWQIDNSQTKEPDQTFIGVGILHNNMLSVNYAENEDKTNTGVAIYEVLLNGERLRGLYTSVANANATGMLRFENGEKIRE